MARTGQLVLAFAALACLALSAARADEPVGYVPDPLFDEVIAVPEPLDLTGGKDDAKKDEGKKDGKGDAKKAEEPKPKKWYEKINFRGYTQIRANETIWHRPGTAAPSHVSDRAVGEAQNFSIRRARVILSGDVGDHLFLYLQPDFAVTPSGSGDQTFFAQLRDLYGDIYLDREKVHRFRVGLSKVPFGWENMQSSSNRLSFDRTDGLNSAVARNERDLGVFYYWTPVEKQRLLKDLVDQGLKGSGNYGIVGLGAYNGQGGSFQEQNENVHVVGRVTWPWELPNGQIVELSTQAYTGRFVVLSSPIRALGQGPSIRPANTLERGNRKGIRDERVGWTAVLYPQPIGFQAEWNVGRGPSLNAAQTAVGERSLHGGYLLGMYKHDTCRWGSVIPYLRWSYYKGGYRGERNAPYLSSNEWDFGVEWQIRPEVELTVQYTRTDRTNLVAIDSPGAVPYRQFEGGLLRFQVQLNY